MKTIVASLSAALVLASAPQAFAEAASGAAWGARNAAPCNAVKTAAAPTPAQAAAILKCRREKVYESSGELWLLEKLNVQVGGAVSFVSMYNTWTMQGADTKKQVYPLRATWTGVVCRNRKDLALYSPADAQRNCTETDYQGDGVCWRTTFGDWDCTVSGRTGATRTKTTPPQ